jgi:hypothetical protein
MAPAREPAPVIGTSAGGGPGWAMLTVAASLCPFVLFEGKKTRTSKHRPYGSKGPLLSMTLSLLPVLCLQ